MTQPDRDTLPGCFAALSADNPVPFLLDADGRVLMTYAEAAAGSAALATVLAERGVVAGDRVAMQVQKCPEALLAYIACVHLGAVLLPMNLAYTAAEVARLVADAEPAVVIDDELLATLVDESQQVDATIAPHAATPDELAAILYTSGTTGAPKGAMLSHRNLASNSIALHQLWGFRPDDVLLHALPIFHTHGLFVATNCSIINGTPMVFLPRFDVDDVLQAMPRCTVMMGVPTFYTRLLDDERFDASVASHMRLFISGSAPLLASTHRQFTDRTGHHILERYGMTETSMITSNPLHGERRPGTVGMPLPDVEVRIDARDGQPGDIEVRGPNVLAGYWRRPELQSTEFTADGWFKTGDVGTFDPDGYLHIVGRSKDLVITGGLNVYPIEVESVLDAIDGVAESAVIGIPHPDFGEAVVAVVVAQQGADASPPAIIAAARSQLAAFKVPKAVHVVDALPRNAMGKVEKAALRRQFGDHPVQSMG